MNQIKDLVAARKLFFEDVWKLYSGLKLGGLLMDQDRVKKFVPKNTFAYVLVSSDSGFTGGVNNQVINAMQADMKEQYDLYVIGGKGRGILEERNIGYKKSYKFHDYKDDKFIRLLLVDLKGYETIVIWYDSFVSIAKQLPKKMEVTFNPNRMDRSLVIQPNQYIFEPSYKEILSYLESVIIGLMFSQILAETDLSLNASRMVLMNRAGERAQNLYNNEKLTFNRLHREQKDNEVKLIFEDYKNAVK
jgi:ATP synthase F1 gamma subunit